MKSVIINLSEQDIHICFNDDFFEICIVENPGCENQMLHSTEHLDRTEMKEIAKAINYITDIY